jgi:hypothetical protein
MVRLDAAVDLLYDRPQKEGRLHKEKVMSRIVLRRRSATVVVFALLLGTIQAPAWAGPKASISIANPPAIVEGNTGSKQISFTLRAKGPRTSRASVSWAPADVTAAEGTDYSHASGTVSFATGKTQTVKVSVLGDLADEPTETFRVVLSSPVNAKLGASVAIGTITDDDDAPPAPVVPSISISDDVVGEGNSGSVTPASFDVALSEPATTEVTVVYATADGDATAGNDYVAVPSTPLSFAPGDTSKSIDVDVKGDVLAAEGNETFTVTLSSPVGATIGDGVATGKIIDDEAAPAVSIGDVTVVEGPGATATFPVTLSHTSAQPVSISYRTAPGTATTADFTEVADSFDFPAGITSRDVVVPIINDAMYEPSETFTVSLTSHPGALAADVTGRGIITDDETAPRVTVRNVTVTESAAAAAAVRVELSHESSQNVVIDYATSDGAAKVVKDYAATSGAVTFTSGQLSKIVPVTVVNDGVAEWRERFAVDVIETLNADLGDGAATVTIMDDDRKPSYTKVTKRIRDGRIHVSGRLSPAHKGRRMTVTLKKRSNGRWVTVRTKRPLLSKGIDVNKDGVLDSVFATRYFNPRNTKRCRIIARFAGDVHHFPSTARRTFHC